ncbi:MAG: hypothetical protein Ct9H300mP1_24500 [Planctomycetaceae bacterium]|nr:MAG: hypothetical protein Ct9H300mP1_24500 [Planctomycetaceae bacterium]
MLKLEATGLPVVMWRTDQDPSVGSLLATCGPGDLPLAVGVVSIHRRRIPHFFGFSRGSGSRIPPAGAGSRG